MSAHRPFPHRRADAAEPRHPEAPSGPEPADLAASSASSAHGAAQSRSVLSRAVRILPVLGLVLGLAIIAYYPASEALDAYHRSQVASTLDAQAQQLDTTRTDVLLQQAHAYNERLAGLEPELPVDEILPYDQQLSEDGHDTAFGYVVIPTIGLTMPVYHGTSDAVLSAGVGHLEWSSLPVGGESTHAVLSAHSGMEGMRAFDDIRALAEGDVFGVKVLGDLYCYRVISTEVVWPDERDSLRIEGGRDLCTLVTCTPYGINDHRLLVHGERCDVPEGFLDQAPSPAAIVTNGRVWPFLVALAVVAAAVLVLVLRRRARGRP